MKCYLKTKNKLKINIKTTVTEISEIVAIRVEEVCIKASISVVSHNRDLHFLCAYHDKYMKLCKRFKSRQKQEKYKEREVEINQKKKVIAKVSCKCDLIEFSWDMAGKVPVNKQISLNDQRTTRLMFILSSVRNWQSCF